VLKEFESLRSFIRHVKRIQITKVSSRLGNTRAKGMTGEIFTKRGFKEVCKFPFYVYEASREDLEK
jgi:hypothetical protein